MEQNIEQLFNKHYIRLNIDKSIIKGFSDASEQPQPDDILINAKGGVHFGLNIDSATPYHSENIRELFSADEIFLFKWDANKATKTKPWCGIIARTPKAIEADRQARENSPVVQIAALDAKIARDMPTVVAHLYDLMTCMMQSIGDDAYARLELNTKQLLPEMSNSERELVQVVGEPNATGKSQWRQLVAKRDKLKSD